MASGPPVIASAHPVARRVDGNDSLQPSSAMPGGQDASPSPAFVREKTGGCSRRPTAPAADDCGSVGGSPSVVRVYRVETFVYAEATSPIAIPASRFLFVASRMQIFQPRDEPLLRREEPCIESDDP